MVNQDTFHSEGSVTAIQSDPVPYVKEPLRVLLEWTSPSRTFKKRDREFYTTAGSIIFLLCIILVFIKEYLLVLVIMAFSFFLYVLNTVKPDPIDHAITNYGITTAGKTYDWDQLGRFWFEEKHGHTLLIIENYKGLPPRLILILGEQKAATIMHLLQPYLIYEKPEKTQLEKAGQWLQEKVPIETSIQSRRISKK